MTVDPHAVPLKEKGVNSNDVTGQRIKLFLCSIFDSLNLSEMQARSLEARREEWGPELKELWLTHTDPVAALEGIMQKYALPVVDWPEDVRAALEAEVRDRKFHTPGG